MNDGLAILRKSLLQPFVAVTHAFTFILFRKFLFDISNSKTLQANSRTDCMVHEISKFALIRWQLRRQQPISPSVAIVLALSPCAVSPRAFDCCRSHCYHALLLKFSLSVSMFCQKYRHHWPNSSAVHWLSNHFEFISWNLL